MATNRTFTMIKPDAVENGHTGAILEKINAAGFRIVAMKKTQMTKADAETFYAVHNERPFFGELVEYMTRGPIVAAILEKDNAVEDFRTLIGATNPADADLGRTAPGGSIYTGTDTADAYADTGGTASDKSGYQKGLEKANALYAFLPPELLDTFAESWAKYGDANIAMGAVRKSSTWKQKFGYLQRQDGSLIMSEIDALATIATYKSTLAEVGITDFKDFEKQFQELISNEVSGLEFQQRIDTVYSGVVEQIPEVEALFRDRYGIALDQPTIFGALINPDIQDKVLAGEIQTLQLQAEASSRGFTTSFSRFQELKNRGLSQEQARGIYQTAGQTISQAESIGRELDISTLEEATLGDTNATKRLQRISAELQSKQGIQLGAAKINDEVTGLIAD